VVRKDSWRTVVSKVGSLAAFSSFSEICRLVPVGYWVMICVALCPFTSIGCPRVSRRRCSRSSTRASSTLPESIWVSATDVSTWVYPRVSSKSTLKVK
jgi:hypothetical protein